MITVAQVIRRLAEKADKEESVAQGIYMQYMSDPLGMTLVRAILSKYPKYNTDMDVAKKATEAILRDMKRRVILHNADLDKEKIFKSLESKVHAGIT